MKYISIGAIIKNEAPYLKEWIEYHQGIGVEHFYLYDNRSDDNTKEVLKPYIDTGLVTYTFWDYPSPCILDAYMSIIDKYKNDSHWIAIIDADEYIVLFDDLKLGDFLREFEDYGGFCMNWLVYGSSGHISRPKGSILESFLNHSEYSNAVNTHVKSIVNPRVVSRYRDPHSFDYIEPFYAVNENKELVDSAFTKQYSGNRIRLNHYYTKSKEDYFIKMRRGRVDVPDVAYTEEIFKHMDLNDIEGKNYKEDL